MIIIKFEFRMIFNFLKAIALTGAVEAANKWNYGKNGADWPNYKFNDNNVKNMCGSGTQQSPINLVSGLPAEQKKFWKEDLFAKLYNNIYDVEQRWNNDYETSNVQFRKDH